MTIKQFTILGERCSGTNFLEEAVTHNFDLALSWDFGWKHFFGFSDYKDADETLFIAIVREPVKWMNSLFQKKYHLQDELRESKHNFLNKTCWSYLDQKGVDKDDYGKEIMEDRHLYTHARYKNIFELRKTKLHYLINDAPQQVKNYIFIRYEDLNDRYQETLSDIQIKFCLTWQKDNIIPINHYKKHKHKTFREGYVRKKWFKKQPETISTEEIFSHPDFDKAIEASMGYYPELMPLRETS